MVEVSYSSSVIIVWTLALRLKYCLRPETLANTRFPNLVAELGDVPVLFLCSARLGRLHSPLPTIPASGCAEALQALHSGLAP